MYTVDRWGHALGAFVVVVLEMLDIITTRMGLDAGLWEENLLMAWTSGSLAGMLFAKVVVVLLVVGVALWLRGFEPRVWRYQAFQYVPYVLVIFIQGWVDVSNIVLLWRVYGSTGY